MEGKKKKYAENRLKNKSINIRTDQVHFDRFEQLAKDLILNKSQLVEKIIDDGFGQVVYVSSPSLDDVFSKFSILISPVANNINQIARQLHSKKDLNSKGIDEVNKAADAMNKLMVLLQNKDKYILEDTLKAKRTNNNGAV